MKKLLIVGMVGCAGLYVLLSSMFDSARQANLENASAMESEIAMVVVR